MQAQALIASLWAIMTGLARDPAFAVIAVGVPVLVLVAIGRLTAPPD